MTARTLSQNELDSLTVKRYPSEARKRLQRWEDKADALLAELAAL